MPNTGWIGVDLDGTLAKYDGWRGVYHVGEPVPLMLHRVKVWRAEGRDVRIFTARIWTDGTQERDSEARKARLVIEVWLQKHLGEVLPITNAKDFEMAELWDDRCVRVLPNTGHRCCC
jgi:hypothetical protein